MKVERLMVMGLAAGLTLSSMVYGSPQLTIEKSTFLDWSAHFRQATLKDGSILSEYVSQTYSGSQESGRLLVSFVPRFECSPIVSLIIATDLTSGPASPQGVSLEIDGRLVQFPALIDEEEGSYRYTFNAPSENQSALLRLLDSGSRFKVVFSDNQSASADPVSNVALQGTEVDFSLLGSKKSAGVARDKCETHVPLPFEPN